MGSNALSLLTRHALAMVPTHPMLLRSTLLMVDVDFIGEFASADTSQWEQAQRVPTTNPLAGTSGGPDSQLLVGAATLILGNGTVIDVAPGTPGGTFCPQLDLFQEPPDPPPRLDDRLACVVIGSFAAGSNSAAWFATEVMDRTADGLVASASFLGDRAVLSAGANAYFTVPIDANVDARCGANLADVLENPTAGYFVTLNPEFEVVAIDCVGRE